jgi:hypothetical protein
MKSSQVALTVDFWERLRIILREVSGNRRKIQPSQILFLEEVASDFAEHGQICSILTNMQEVEKKLAFMKTLPDANFGNWYHLEYEAWAAKSSHLSLIYQTIVEEMRKLAMVSDDFGTVYNFAKDNRLGKVDRATMQWALDKLATLQPQVDFRKWYEGASYAGDPLIVAWAIIQQAKHTEEPEKLVNLFLNAAYQESALKKERFRWSEWPSSISPWITMADAQAEIAKLLNDSSASDFGSWMKAINLRSACPSVLFPTVLERMERFAKSSEEWRWYYYACLRPENPEHFAVKEFRKNRALDILAKQGDIGSWLDIYIHHTGSSEDKERAVQEIKKRADDEVWLNVIVSRLCPRMSGNWVLNHDAYYRLLPWALNELKSQCAKE